MKIAEISIRPEGVIIILTKPLVEENRLLNGYDDDVIIFLFCLFCNISFVLLDHFIFFNKTKSILKSNFYLISYSILNKILSAKPKFDAMFSNRFVLFT